MTPRVIALIGGLALAACGSGAVEPGAPLQDVAQHDLAMTREQIAHAGIRWSPAVASTSAEVVEVSGQLAPNEDHTARLGSPARARVLTVHVHMGERVVRHQPLVTLASEQAASARAEHAKAVADLGAQRVAARYARTALGRAERLLELKAISRQDVERARVDQEEAESMQARSEAEVERARVTLAQLGVSESGEIVVRSPLAGVVLTREAVPGTVVDAGDPLLMITDPSTLWLDIAATERVAPVLRRGERVTFSVRELAPRVFEAVIENVGGALDATTRTLPVHAVVLNGSGALRPAMFATVMLPLGEVRAGVAVPEGAMQLLDERPVVFTVVPLKDGGARFERRDVDVGARTGRDIHIVRGLSAGDIVVTDGAFAVKSEFARLKLSTD